MNVLVPNCFKIRQRNQWFHSVSTICNFRISQTPLVVLLRNSEKFVTVFQHLSHLKVVEFYKDVRVGNWLNFLIKSDDMTLSPLSTFLSAPLTPFWFASVLFVPLVLGSQTPTSFHMILIHICKTNNKCHSIYTLRQSNFQSFSEKRHWTLICTLL